MAVFSIYQRLTLDEIRELDKYGRVEALKGKRITRGDDGRPVCILEEGLDATSVVSHVEKIVHRWARVSRLSEQRACKEITRVLADVAALAETGKCGLAKQRYTSFNAFPSECVIRRI